MGNSDLFSRACKVIPGGVNSPVRAFRAVGGTPLFISEASGARIRDTEGNDYIDYVCSWGPMILGHGHADDVGLVDLDLDHDLDLRGLGQRCAETYEANELARRAAKLGNAEQFQLFTPTPMSLSTCMYWTGLDPRTMEPVKVVYDFATKKRMKTAMSKALDSAPRSG